MKKMPAVTVLLCVAGAGLLVWGSTASRPPTDSDGAIELSPTYDLGQLDHDTAVRVSIPFRNRSSAAVRLRSVVAGCSCIQVDFPKHDIVPGDSGAIAVQYRAAGSPGTSVDRTVEIVLDQPAGEVHRVKIVGRMKHVLTAAPPQWSVRSRTHEPIHRVVYLRASDSHPFQIREVVTDLPELMVTKSDDELNSEHTLEFEWKPSDPEWSGKANGTIRIATTSPLAPNLEVPITIWVTPRP